MASLDSPQKDREQKAETVVIERVYATEQDRQYARAVLEPLTDRQRLAVYAVVLAIATETGTTLAPPAE